MFDWVVISRHCKKRGSHELHLESKLGNDHVHAAGSGSGTTGVVRGSSFLDISDTCRVAVRRGKGSFDRYDDGGYRVVLSVLPDTLAESAE